MKFDPSIQFDWNYIFFLAQVIKSNDLNLRSIMNLIHVIVQNQTIFSAQTTNEKINDRLNMTAKVEIMLSIINTPLETENERKTMQTFIYLSRESECL